jgi:hypothetical protein
MISHPNYKDKIISTIAMALVRLSSPHEEQVVNLHVSVFVYIAHMQTSWTLARLFILLVIETANINPQDIMTAQRILNNQQEVSRQSSHQLPTPQSVGLATAKI